MRSYFYKKLNAVDDVSLLFSHVGEHSPFLTPHFAGAIQSLGREVWVIGSPDQNAPTELALGFVKRGRLSVELEFYSAPAVVGDPRFWQAVETVCRQADVTDIILGSFGSPAFQLPLYAGEVSRQKRHEFILPLRDIDLASQLSPKHKQNVKKALKAGMVVRRSRDDLGWVEQHLALMGHSATRRLARGEAVSFNSDISEYRALLQQGAAELFQAVRGDEVLSSALVLLSPRTAYFHSAGTRSEGMSTGASHFLLFHITHILQCEGRWQFNFGGAREGSELARFKRRFGAEAAERVSATYYVGPRWKRKLRHAVELLRHDRPQLLRIVTGTSSRMLVFGLETSSAPTVSRIAIPGARLEAIDEERVARLASPPDDPEFKNRQLARLRRFGTSYAYGVYLGDALTHVSWLLPRHAVAIETPRILELNEDEAEITACETLPAYRGQAIYGYAIQQLASIARSKGIRRVYMKTAETNLASQNGIRKAGLKPLGSVRLVKPPLRPSEIVVRRNLSW
jgi:hypothetical protein